MFTRVPERVDAQRQRPLKYNRLRGMRTFNLGYAFMGMVWTPRPGDEGEWEANRILTARKGRPFAPILLDFVDRLDEVRESGPVRGDDARRLADQLQGYANFARTPLRNDDGFVVFDDDNEIVWDRPVDGANQQYGTAFVDGMIGRVMNKERDNRSALRALDL